MAGLYEGVCRAN